MSSETFGVHSTTPVTHPSIGVHQRRPRRSGSTDTEGSHPSQPGTPEAENSSIIDLSIRSGSSVELMDRLYQRQDRQLADRLEAFSRSQDQKLAERLEKFSKSQDQKLAGFLETLSQNQEQRITDSFEALSQHLTETITQEVRNAIYGQMPTDEYPAISYPQPRANEKFQLAVSSVIDEWASVSIKELRERIIALEHQRTETSSKPSRFSIRKSASNLKVIDSYPSAPPRTRTHPRSS